MDCLILRSPRVIIICLLAMVYYYLFSITPVHALTACQSAQQQVNNYKINPTVNQYCSYSVDATATEAKIWQDCDQRTAVVKTYTYSPGGVGRSDTIPTQCCYWDEDHSHYHCNDSSYTYTYYKTSVTAEYCDGHTVTTEYPYGGVYGYSYYSYSGSCGNPGYSHTTTQVVQNVTDCSQYVTRYLYTTIPIPTNCDPLNPKKDPPCYGSQDVCCDSSNTNCGKKDPCLGDPNCGEAPQCPRNIKK